MFTMAAVILVLSSSHQAAATHLSCLPGSAQWMGGSPALWSNPANWSAGMVPSSTTDVCITGGDTVVVDVMPARARQLVSDGTIDIQNSWSLILGGESEINRLLLNGSLLGAGPLALSRPGSVWTGGTISTSLEVSTPPLWMSPVRRASPASVSPAA